MEPQLPAAASTIQQYSLLLIVALMFLSGVCGGFVNALIAEGGLKSSHRKKLSDGGSIWIPGWQGNLLIGGIASIVIWGLYGNIHMSHDEEVIRQAIGGLLAGAGGGRIITNEVEKRLLTVRAANLEESTQNMVELAEKITRDQQGKPVPAPGKPSE
jgi:hypothetical protein